MCHNKYEVAEGCISLSILKNLLKALQWFLPAAELQRGAGISETFLAEKWCNGGGGGEITP